MVYFSKVYFLNVFQKCFFQRSDKWLSAGESVDQVEGPLGLVIGHHVACIPHLGKKSRYQMFCILSLASFWIFAFDTQSMALAISLLYTWCLVLLILEDNGDLFLNQNTMWV